MRLVKLSKEQIEKIYNERMQLDFPPDELKPLDRMLLAIDQGFYEGLGLEEQGELTGYTFLLQQEGSYLVDYLAIFAEKRSKGYGSNLLRLLREYLNSADNIIIEVENPDFSQDEHQRIQRIRRLEFYLENQCTDTGVRASAFGVPYVVLRMGQEMGCDKEKIRNLYKKFYQAILPMKLYEGNVIV